MPRNGSTSNVVAAISSAPKRSRPGASPIRPPSAASSAAAISGVRDAFGVSARAAAIRSGDGGEPGERKSLRPSPGEASRRGSALEPSPMPSSRRGAGPASLRFRSRGSRPSAAPESLLAAGAERRPTCVREALPRMRLRS
eukprot:4339107-Prymnesium_polylepis.1